MTSSTASVAAPAPRPASRWPGLLLVAALALLAQWLGHVFPLVGGAVIGIVLGMVVAGFLQPSPRLAPGIAFAGKQVLQASIVLLGLGLNLGQVARTGLHSLAVTMTTLAVAFASAWILAPLLKVHDKLALLIGVGTAICGGSAIAAVTPIVEPDEHDAAYAISTIFLFNVAAVLLFPPLGHLLHLSDAGFGLWAGTAINDTSSVVAAGYHYSRAAGDYATIVKLTRATLIVPICLALVALQAWRRQRQGDGGFRMARAFPWFILWFLAAAALRSVGAVPAAALPALHGLAEFMIVAALTAIGLSANLRRMAATGPRPILLGLGVWAAVATASLLVQLGTGQT
ncbi:MAG: putative sulfate exporter family transporter [Pseudoxanthomonas sp.]